MAISLMDNIGEQGTLGVLQAMSMFEISTIPEGILNLRQPFGKFFLFSGHAHVFRSVAPL